MNRNWPELLDGEFELPEEPEEADEKLLRQVTPHQWDDTAKQPASTAFGPANIDHGQASFSRSSKVTPQAAHDWHQRNAASRSVGVWSVTVRQVQRRDGRAVDDSVRPETKAPAHCYVDYRSLTKREERALRGWLLLDAIKEEVAISAFQKDAPASNPEAQPDREDEGALASPERSADGQ